MKSESFKKGIISSTFFSFLAKLLVFCNSLVIAFYFGANIRVDFYFYIISFIGILVGFFSSLNQAVIIPHAMHIRENIDHSSSVKFLNFFIVFYLTLGTIISILIACFPVYFFRFISSYNVNQIKENIQLIYLLTPLSLLMLLVNYFNEILISMRYFSISMVTSMINNSISICFIFFWGEKFKISSVATGLLVGYILNIVILTLLVYKKLEWNCKFDMKNITKKILSNSFYVQMANLTTFFTSYTPLYLLSGLGAGVITSFNFGTSISQLPNQLIAAQFSSVVGVKLNELSARNEILKLYEVFITTTKFLLYLVVPISFFFFQFADEIVSIFLKRGAFDQSSVEQTALFLRFLGLLLPALVINSMAARLFIATQKIKLSFWYQIITNIGLIILLIILVNFFKINGYLLGINIVYLMNIFGIYFLFKKYFDSLSYSVILLYFLKLIFISAILSAIIFFISSRVSIDVTSLKMLIMGALFFLFYTIVSLVFNINSEFNQFVYNFFKSIKSIKQ